MRESVPMPSHTCLTSAPTASQIEATALMNEIFIARNALEACLISSALLVLVMMSGGGICAPVGARNRVRAAVIGAARQRLRKFRAKRRAALGVRAHHDAVGIEKIGDAPFLHAETPGSRHVEVIGIGAVAQHDARTHSLVYTGTVLFSTTILYPSMAPAISARHRFHIGEVGIALFRRRRPHSDKYCLALPDGGLQIARKLCAVPDGAPSSSGRNVLVDRNLAAIQRGDFCWSLSTRIRRVRDRQNTPPRPDPHTRNQPPRSSCAGASV